MWAYVGESPKASSNGMLAVLGGLPTTTCLPFLAGLVIALGVATQLFLGTGTGLSSDSLYAWFTLEFSNTLVGVLILVGLLMTIVSCGSSLR